MMTLGSQPRVSGSLLLAALAPGVQVLSLALEGSHHRESSQHLDHKVKEHEAAQDDDERDQHVSQINDHRFLLKEHIAVLTTVRILQHVVPASHHQAIDS